MIKQVDQIAVTWEGQEKILTPVKNLHMFIENIKKVFKTLPTTFTLSYRDEHGNMKTVNNESDYKYVSTQMNMIVKVTTNEEEKSNARINLNGMNNLHNCSSVINTPKDSNAILTIDKEKKGTTLAIITEAHSIILNEEDKEEKTSCISCHGCGRSRGGTECKECRGTGEMHVFVRKYIEELIEDIKRARDDARRAQESRKVLESEIEKKDNELKVQAGELDKVRSVVRRLKDKLREEEMDFKKQLEKERQDLASKKKNVIDSIYKEKSSICTVCHSKIECGEKLFLCQGCPEIIVCEDCEDTFKHEHALLRLYIKGTINYYKGKIDPGKLSKEVANIGKTVTFPLTVWNTGRRPWPKETVLRYMDNDVPKQNAPIIGIVKPGNKHDVLLKWKTPEKLRETYRFKLFTGEVYFGDELVLEIKGLKEHNKNKELVNPNINKKDKDVTQVRAKRLFHTDAENEGKEETLGNVRLL